MTQVLSGDLPIHQKGMALSELFTSQGWNLRKRSRSAAQWGN